MKVAVVLSTYNGEKYLREQIESILSQTSVDISLFIRDDGSTDGTKEILQNYESRKNVKIIYGNNVGYVRSFSTMLFQADQFDYYAFSDQDDYWLSNKIYEGCRQLEKFDLVPALYYSNLWVCNEKLEPQKKTSLDKRKMTLRSVITRRSIAGCTMIINNKMYNVLVGDNNQASNITVSHDNYIVTLCYTIGGKVICDSNSYIHYRQHGQNTSGSTNSPIKRIRKEIKEIKNGKGNEVRIASSILKHYSNCITSDSKATLELIQSVQGNYVSRLKCAISPSFSTGDIRLTIVGKIKMLFGII